MREEFIKIYNKELDGQPYKECLLDYVKKVIGFYELHHEASKQKFQFLLEKYSFEALQKADEYHNPTVSLYHGAGEYKFFGCIDDGGAVFPSDEEIGIIVPELSYWHSDCKLSDHLKEEVSNWESQINTSIVYTWLSLIWQEIEGYKYGTKVATLENSVIRIFVFNDLCWQDQTDYKEVANKSNFIERHFKRNLSIPEIYSRVNLSSGYFTYTCNYRKFKLQNSVIEFLIGSDYVFVRRDGSGLEENAFDSARKLQSWLKKEADVLIQSGYQETTYKL